jgi:hypothetical protein
MLGRAMRPRTTLPVLLFILLFLVAPEATAFCGFYVAGGDAKLFNDATQVVLMRDGTRTVLSMQNTYKGPPEKFAMVVPVPVVLQKENVKTLKKELFEKLDKLTAPRLVEYWEQDPCALPEPKGGMRGGGVARLAAPAAAAGGKAEDLGVKIEAQFTVGEYEIVILSAKDSTGLDTWLRQERYTIPEGAEPYLRPYVQAGSKFFVARVDPTKVSFHEGLADLSPLRFHYDATDFSLPVRLGLINSSGTQDLVIHILAKNKRYAPANYPTTTIPTNLDLSEDAKASFGAFYTQLFDRTLEKNPRAIVTEYAWGASSCDPCPGPTADMNDVVSLGGDVLAQPVDYHTWWSTPWVVTRLHARYSKESLGQDIVFAEAPPITGGREVRDSDGALEHGAKELPGGVSNFQARYAIRHPWTGPIACKEPKRGIWGPPPGGVQVPPSAATKIAFAPRGGATLTTLVRSDVPELGMKGAGGGAAAAALPSPATSLGASPTARTQPAEGGAAAPPKSGCGSCAASRGAQLDAGWLVAWLAACAAAARRRRARAHGTA